jgi:cyclophilin family peptidyl-prolyl cis-trans isomerase
LKPILFIFLICTSLSFSQYTKNDSSLINTTFKREFNKQIIDEYLNSNISQKINAALLSISHSEDTSFINSIKDIDFIEHSQFAAFALGQLGQSSNSTDYLFKMFLSSKDQSIRYRCLEALGKTADSIIYNSLMDLYSQSFGKGFEGISVAIYNFHLRGIFHKNSSTILLNELNNDTFQSKRKEDAVFTLLRTGADSSHIHALSTLLTNSKNHSLFFEQYTLGIFRKAKYFPPSFELLKRFTESDNWLLRNEISKTGVYFDFENESQLETYLTLLTDPNQNVQRQFAISLREIKFAETNLLNIIKTKIVATLEFNQLSKNVYGELFNTLTKLFPDSSLNYYERYKEKLSSEFIYSFIGTKYQNLNISIDSLLNIYNDKSENEKIALSQALVKISETNDDKNLSSFLLQQLEKGSAAVSGTIASELSEIFIRNNSTELENRILTAINLKKNDCDYTETILSFYELSHKISKEFAVVCTELIASSELFPLQKKFIPTNSTKKIIKRYDYFVPIYNNVFKYKFAVIRTTKGDIKIRFKPEVAPISTGSFIYLSILNTFKNNLFHRVVPGFVIQGGDPSTSGWGGPGYDIISECSPLNYTVGMVGMASAGKDTEGSQFFIMQANHPHLNGRYTIFAEVVDGLESVFNLEQNDVILNIVLE